MLKKKKPREEPVGASGTPEYRLIRGFKDVPAELVLISCRIPVFHCHKFRVLTRLMGMSNGCQSRLYANFFFLFPTSEIKWER